MRGIRVSLFAAGLVGSPLLMAAYWLLYPAYGDLHAVDIAADIGASPGRTQAADIMAFGAVFLAVPGALAYLRALVARSPWLARAGCVLAVVGWLAILPPLTLDAVAIELAQEPKLFGAVYTSPVIVALSAVATLHIVGGVLIGAALVRTRLVPRALAVAAALAPIVHLAANLAGLLWVDLAAWLVMAAAGAAVLPGLARLVAADEAVLGREQGGGGARSNADLGVDVLDMT